MTLLTGGGDAGTAFSEKWRILSNIGEETLIMVRHCGADVEYAPMFQYRAPFLQPHRLTEAQRLNAATQNPNSLKGTADKLRWYRHKKALLQREVAAHAGLDRTTYSSYEEGRRDHYPLDKLMKIAALMDVSVAELLDEYNLFLLRGQGAQVKALRQGLSLTQREFAARYGVYCSTVNDWENDRVRMTKASWERIFQAGPQEDLDCTGGDTIS